MFATSMFVNSACSGKSVTSTSKYNFVIYVRDGTFGINDRT